MVATLVDSEALVSIQYRDYFIENIRIRVEEELSVDL